MNAFIDCLRGTMDARAALNFGPIEQRMLAMSMERCGLHTYPALSGPAEGFWCSGEMICQVCDQNYYTHPMDWRVIGYGDMPFFERAL